MARPPTGRSTPSELKTLRAKERLPQLRPANTAFDGQFQIPTLHRLGVDGVFADNAGTAVAVRRRVFR